MNTNERDQMLKALNHIRAAKIAISAEAPVGPCIDAAERELLRALFNEEEVEKYLNNLYGGEST